MTGGRSVSERFAEISARVAEAAVRSGRQPEEVTLVGVSKKQPIDALFEAFDAGLRNFGESQAQELVAKAEGLRATGRQPRWHMVGRLQRNKINAVIGHVGLIHTVDRPELAHALSKRVPAGGVEVLVQVNIGREAQKGGIEPERAIAFARDVCALPGLKLRGLMAIPPAHEDPVPYFEAMAELSFELRQAPEGGAVDALSMGMSDDYETAIACGATMVRVGTALFGEREDG